MSKDKKGYVMKWTVRVNTEITFDFEVEAETEEDVEVRVRDYLPYIDGGGLKKQPISVKVDHKDKLTNVFVMEKEICDAFELDESYADRGI